MTGGKMAINQPLYKLYKMDISYFSGKLEAYLRYKGIPHQPVDCENLKSLQRIGKKTGFQKVPAIELQDGRWLTDTTPMMQWLEKKHPHPSVFPEDPALRFVALLIEDYGDEWLWRPAMWWRWVPKVSRITLGRQIAQLYSKWLTIPLGFYFANRQLNEWLWNDGVDKANSGKVRDMYFRELEFLEALLSEQPYILGSHPSIADFGYFGSFFRHFGNDPISAEVMRRRAPNTYEWVARLWNTKPEKLSSIINWRWPTEEYWKPLLERICTDYLPYLHQNALAFQKNKKRFDFKGKNHSFKKTVTTVYRVWCRQQLQREFSLLNSSDQQKVEQLFLPYGGLSILQRDGVIDSGIDERLKLPIDTLPHANRPGMAQRIFGQPRN